MDSDFLLYFPLLQLTCFCIAGIRLAPQNLRYEFWVTMLSCYGTMNLHYRTIDLFLQITNLIKHGSIMLVFRCFFFTISLHLPHFLPLSDLLTFETGVIFCTYTIFSLWTSLTCFDWQEMMGLAYFMLDQSRKDAEYCMESAFSTYLVKLKHYLPSLFVLCFSLFLVDKFWICNSLPPNFTILKNKKISKGCYSNVEHFIYVPRG